MSIGRQQRAARDRRLVSLNAPQVLPLAALQLIIVGAHSLSLQPRNMAQPPDGSTSVQPVLLQGVPAVRRNSDSTYCTAAALNDDGTLLTLTFGGATIDPGETFDVGPYDPAIRTLTGGFAAPGQIQVAIDAPPVQAYLAQRTDVGVIALNLAPHSGVEFNFALQDWRHVETDAQPTGADFGPTSMTLHFGEDVPEGDSIRYTGVPIIAGASGSRQFDGGATVVTS